MFDLAHDHDIARLTLNRPEARNAIPAAGWAALERSLDEAEGSGATLLVVRGAGTAFCAGADLADLSAMRVDAGARRRFRTAMRSAIERLARLPMPVIAAIDGACFGAGVALAMACDIRVAGRAARFAITPAKFGISYPQEDVGRLVALIGPGQAARLLLSAGAVDAAEAARIGLVEILAEESAHEEAERLARAIAAGSAASHRILKRGIALAAAGAARDADQDRAFDDLLGSEGFAGRLAAARR
ncbi:MAG TPA: enoyl-CoA hydratase/isomerase family protein [Allosphingosinicella sp.]|nr:enoyl-CoA hydratase/isomerase family protein [Allosphingosinicella sp.]